MADFLRLETISGTPATWVLKVVEGTFREEPLEWQGEEEPSFSGQLLSTQSNARRKYTCTVAIENPIEVDRLLEFIASSLDAATGLPLGFRNLYMTSTYNVIGGAPDIVSGARRGQQRRIVSVRMGAAVATTDYVVGGGGAESSRISQLWHVDLILRQV